MDIRLLEGDIGMGVFNRFFAIGIAVAAEVCLLPAALAQTADTAAADSHGEIQRTADLVNLLRTVLDPNPAPVLVSPEERTVSGKTTADPASPVATTLPVVTMPDIALPEEESGKPDKTGPLTEEPAQLAAVVSSSKKDADEADSEPYPPFSYVFFFGEYVPYFDGWYYYSDRWLWGRRWPAPPEPPGWIPPPPPPRPRPFDPVRPDIGPGPRPGIAGNRGGSAPGKTGSPSASAQRSQNVSGNTIPVAPDSHRIPRKNETGGEPLPKDTNIPVAAGQHRIPGKVANQIDFPEKNSNIPVAPSSHRITGNAARQNPAPEKNSNIPIAPSQHRIPRSNR